MKLMVLIIYKCLKYLTTFSDVSMQNHSPAQCATVIPEAPSVKRAKTIASGFGEFSSGG